MVRFQRNNIVFRIASADAISKFKAIQAHSFVQLMRKDLGFDSTAREALLLEYDRFSQWIFRMERICLTTGNTSEPRKLCAALLESFYEETSVVESVMENFSDIFTDEVYKFSKLLHRNVATVIEQRFMENAGQSVENIYTNVVNTVSGYLQYVLVSLHEFNNNVITKNEIPFLSVCDFCLSSVGREDRASIYSLVALRAKFFMDFGTSNEFVVKNYTDHEVFDEMTVFFRNMDITLLHEDHQQTV
jgi:hypothetical protein